MADILSAAPVQPHPSGMEENLWALHDVKFWRIDGSLRSVENSSEARVFGGGRTSVNAAYEGFLVETRPSTTTITNQENRRLAMGQSARRVRPAHAIMRTKRD
ncbi:protein of unknown function [Magnetospirillum sp. XM-1]|nr:protein of unknown function [Magnetospirillum sp. XM-1]